MAKKPRSSALKKAPPVIRDVNASIEPSPGDKSQVSRIQLLFCWALIVLAVAIVWSNSLSAPFVLDDEESVVGNMSLRSPAISSWLVPPAKHGETVSGRPLLNFSFALNYAAAELDVRGYHLGNIGIHCLAGFLLFGLLKKTPLLLGRFSHPPKSGASDKDHRMPWLALLVVLLWLLHPLQTAAVTYVSQRAEVLAGFFYLLTIYAFVQAATSESQQRSHKRLWNIVAVAACTLGVATKETVATAPLIVWLYDRTFIAGSFRDAYRARRKLYWGLVASWALLGILIYTNAGRGGSAGVASPLGAWHYLLTQFEAIVVYLRLAFWPVGQVFDYGMPSVTGLAAVWPEALLLVLLGGCVVGAVQRNYAAGFWGAWFFVLLSPSSSVVTIATQTVAEHRMYLPLLGVIMLVALLFTRMMARVSLPATWGALGILAVALGSSTFARNEVYRSALSLWEDTVAKRPDNPRAHHNLGVELARSGRRDEARTSYRRVLALQPTHAFAHFNLGVLAAQEGDWADAEKCFQAAVKADPRYTDARTNLADTLCRLGRVQEGLEQYRISRELTPDALDVRTAYAATLIAVGRDVEGMAELREVLTAAPDFAEARYHLGLVFEKKGDAVGAEQEFSTALRLKPALPQAHLALGNRRAAQGNSAAAEHHYREALRLDPGSAEAHFGLGNLLARQKDFTSAIAEYDATLRLAPNHIQARNNLANCQLMVGQIAEAIVNYENVARARPDDLAVQRNLELARELVRGR